MKDTIEELRGAFALIKNMPMNTKTIWFQLSGHFNYGQFVRHRTLMNCAAKTPTRVLWSSEITRKVVCPRIARRGLWNQDYHREIIARKATSPGLARRELWNQSAVGIKYYYYSHIRPQNRILVYAVCYRPIQFFCQHLYLLGML